MFSVQLTVKGSSCAVLLCVITAENIMECVGHSINSFINIIEDGHEKLKLFLTPARSSCPEHSLMLTPNP